MRAQHEAGDDDGHAQQRPQINDSLIHTWLPKKNPRTERGF
jgi:hypothetical protein